MTGYTGYRALGDFAKSHQQALTKNFGIRRREVPSYSTIRRVIMGVDWTNFIEIFNQWANQLTITDDESKWLAIDGKSLRSTIKHYCDNQQNFVSIISVFCQDNGLVLYLAKMENKKESEISHVQDIARISGLKGKVFTADALHCQKQTVKLITEGENDYLIAVKNNQPTLYKCALSQAKNTMPLSQKTTEDISHGRHITRQVSVFEVPEKIKSLWSNSQRLIQFQRSGKRGLKPYEETAYYLSSVSENAEVFGEKIRGHWRIENQLHWVKDVIFKEDKSPLHQFKPMTNFSILSTIAMNLFRILGFLSVTEGRRWLCERFWRLTFLLE